MICSREGTLEFLVKDIVSDIWVAEKSPDNGDGKTVWGIGPLGKIAEEGANKLKPYSDGSFLCSSLISRNPSGIWLIILVARGVITTMRSTKLRSSRTFPGHE